MGLCLLDDRVIVAVSGDDAEAFLNRLLTNDVLGMAGGTEARYGALLSPQGKILHDVLVCKRHDAFWLDCAGDQAVDLVNRLTVFRLRSKVAIAIERDLGVAASWGGLLLETPGPTFRDPRHDGLGYRIVAKPERLRFADKDPASYQAHRIELGIPQSGVDFILGDSFVHDANLDLLHGVDFDKGCYVGQEVVSRVHHRGSTRKRVVKVRFHGDPPSSGAPLVAGTLQIGQITSLARQDGLATARLDRLEEAEAAHVPVLAGATLVAITLPVASVVVPPTYDDDDW